MISRDTYVWLINVLFFRVGWFQHYKQREELQIYGPVSLACTSSACWDAPEKNSCHFCSEDRNVREFVSAAYTLTCQWEKNIHQH